ncbi:hypothetical protein DUNSADRAFT_1311 [Dunaliella salina]|uniref:Uncharacterized protein n=1 Tax=Dunaliella salina TaxID=3046 RepID=A0ABQ7FXN7_DUNSA|nr:hypothetical protein DUNSADRAFT_1311 [Dunaliella salina]|eukprot:KAF5827115.1 hypothetical protein DUNSADRAFT_1311 [Dunaliella salina]
MAPSISPRDVVLVQSMIERCLQHYMTRAEVVQTLHTQAKVEPGFTSLVWQKLEDQNPDFFKAYYLRLKLKDQVIMFNYLVEQQMLMVQKLNSSWVPPMDVSMPPGTQPLQPSVQPAASFMLPPRADPYSHAQPHSNAHIPNNSSSSNGNNGGTMPQGCGQQSMGSMLTHSRDFVASGQGHHIQHSQGHSQQQHNQQHHSSEPLIHNTPTLQTLRCLGGR